MQTLAEKAAWEIAEKEGFELVAINPTLVLGRPSPPPCILTSPLNLVVPSSSGFPRSAHGWRGRLETFISYSCSIKSTPSSV